MSYHLMAPSLKNNDSFAKNLIKPDFYIQNVLKTFYDQDSTPIIKDSDLYYKSSLKRQKRISNK